MGAALLDSVGSFVPFNVSPNTDLEVLWLNQMTDLELFIICGTWKGEMDP